MASTERIKSDNNVRRTLAGTLLAGAMVMTGSDWFVSWIWGILDGFAIVIAVNLIITASAVTALVALEEAARRSVEEKRRGA